MYTLYIYLRAALHLGQCIHACVNYSLCTYLTSRVEHECQQNAEKSQKLLADIEKQRQTLVKASNATR